MREMSEAPAASPPLGRSDEIVRHSGGCRLDPPAPSAAAVILGWATGGHWAGYVASMHSDRLSGVILLNSLYGGTATHPVLGRGSELEDPGRPGRFRASYGSYRFNTAASLLPAWDRSIPLKDKTVWRSKEVVDAYLAAALEGDASSMTRTPPSFRAPSGAMEDSFYLATGRQLWDASLIRVPMLVIRSGNDFWSRSEDAERLVAHAANAPSRLVTIPDATHFVHLDRPERGRHRLMTELIAFLEETRDDFNPQSAGRGERARGSRHATRRLVPRCSTVGIVFSQGLRPLADKYGPGMENYESDDERVRRVRRRCELVLYEDAWRGAMFQYHEAFEWCAAR